MNREIVPDPDIPVVGGSLPAGERMLTGVE